MPLYPDPIHGGSMEAANDADARAKGWTPAAGTFGVNTYPNGQSGGGSGGDGGGTTRIDPGDMDALRKFFGQTSGFSREELAEKKREFDETMAAQERQWQREGLPELEIKKRLAALEEQKFAEGVRQFNTTTGLDYLKFASTLGGPADYFQSADFMRGARGQAGVPTFLSSLANAVPLAAFQGVGTTAPVAQSASTLSQQMMPAPSAAGAAPPGLTAPAAGVGISQAMADLLARNPSLANPAYQQVLLSDRGWVFSPNETSAMREAAAQGWDSATNTYNASRVPVTGATPAASAAPAPAPGGLGTSPGGYNYDDALNQIGQIFKGGPTSIAPGTLEKLDPNELDLLRSGAKKLGLDPDAWLRAYQRAGVGQAASASF